MSLDAQTLAEFSKTLRRFVEEQLIPAEKEVSQKDSIPDSIVQQMAALGLFGISIPDTYGGLGLTMGEECHLMMILGRAAPAFRSVIGTNVGIGSQGIIIQGTKQQKETWLPKLATGEAIASFCLTEPEAGSDAACLRTSARVDGDDYILNGTKCYITNANRASVLTVMARTDPQTKGARGISAFLVPSNTKGVRIGSPEKKMGQQGAHICDVIFEDARISKHALLGKAGEGFITAMQILQKGRLHISAVCVGLAERLVEEMCTYAATRQQFGKPIGEQQLVQAMLADSKTEATAGRAMVRDAAHKVDGGEDIGSLTSCCKYYCSEMVGRVADRAVQVFGGAGYMCDTAVERLYRDARVFRIYEGTSQIQQVIIARDMLARVAKS